MDIKEVSIAVIGDKDLVSGLRLAGVKHYCVIEDGGAEEVRQALGDFLNNPDIGIIVIMEDYAKHGRDLISRVQERKVAPAVVIEVPSKRGTKYEDVGQYYKSYIRESIGFDIEI